MRRVSVLSLFALACAAAIAGCGGGGGSGGSSQLPPSSPRSQSGIALAIKIPAPSSSTSARLRPSFISPGTQSIGVVVTNPGMTPGAAQYVNVSTCPQVSGVTTCTITVQAAYGNDTFTITAYSGTDGGGSVLATGSTVATVSATGTSTVAVSLGGVMSTIAVTAGTAALPLGQSTTVNVVPKDASGAAIIGSFSPAVTVSAPNMTLATTSIPDSTHGTNIAAAWQYAFAGGSSTAITATSGTITGTLTLPPATGFAYYQAGTNATTDIGSFKMIAGSNGKLYYTTFGAIACDTYGLCYSSSGAVHQFDPATATDTEISLSEEGAGLAISSDGALWIAGGTSDGPVIPKIYRMAPGQFSASALTAIPIPLISPSSPPPTIPNLYSVRSLAQDGGGNMWFQDMHGHRYMKISVAGPYTTAAITAYTLPRGPAGTTPNAKGSARNVIYASGVLVVPDFHDGAVDVVDPTTGTVTGQYVTNLQAAEANPTYDAAIQYDAATDGTNVFLTELYSSNNYIAPNGALEEFNPSTHTFTTLPYVAGTVGTQPTVPSVSGSLVYVADFFKNSLDVVNLSTNTARSVPMLQNGQSYFTLAAAVAAVPDGTVWFPCVGNNGLNNAYTGPLCVGHSVYIGSTWSLWPSTSITLYGAGVESGQLMGVMENPSANSGPFTVTSSDTTICTIANASDHNFVIAAVAPGACTVSVTDHNHVTQTVNVIVSSVTTGVVQSRKRELP